MLDAFPERARNAGVIRIVAARFLGLLDRVVHVKIIERVDGSADGVFGHGFRRPQSARHGFAGRDYG